MTGVSTLGQALEQIRLIQEQQSRFAELSLQVTTGRKTQSFAGLGNDVLSSKRARADFKSLETTINNIKKADRRINEMSASLSKFKEQAENFLGFLIGFSQQSAHQLGEVIKYDDPLTLNVIETTQVGRTSDEPDADLATLQNAAANIYEFIVDLMNAKETDRYLFSGAETLTQPLTDSGSLDAAISSLVSQWKNGAISTDNLVADFRDRTATAGNPDAITDTIMGYSAALSAGNAGRIFVRVDDAAEIDYTALANDQAFRDIIVAVAYFKNPDLGPVVDAYIPPNGYPGVPDAQGAPGATIDEMKENFYSVFNSLTQMVSAAIDRIDQVAASIENARARMHDIRNSHTDEQNLLLTTISDVEDIDLNDAAIKVKALQTQLQASYAVTATLQQYTLANFLSGGR